MLYSICLYDFEISQNPQDISVICTLETGWFTKEDSITSFFSWFLFFKRNLYSTCKQVFLTVYSNPAIKHMLKVSNRSTRRRSEICSKLTKKDTRTTSTTSLTLKIYFRPSSSVSIVDFGQVICVLGTEDYAIIVTWDLIDFPPNPVRFSHNMRSQRYPYYTTV